MSDQPSKTDRKLARSGNKQTLQGIVGDTDADDIEIFGYEVIYTTGEFTVSRDDLLAKASQLGLPEWMLPSQTRPHNAFSYAMQDLLDGRAEFDWKGRPVRLDIKQNNSRYSYTVGAETFVPPEMTSSDTGEWVAIENADGQQGLGVIEYENPDNGEPYLRFVDYVDDDMSLYAIWADEQTGLKARAEDLFDNHWQNWNRGKDINTMTYYLVDQWTDSIRLRDACYFVPANHTWVDAEGTERSVSDLIDAFTLLYEWLNGHKQDPESDIVQGPRYGQQTEMSVVEIMDTDRQRKMVERKVQERLGDMASSMASSVIDRLDDDDTLVEDVTGEVSETLDNLTAVASEYDGLLENSKAKMKTKQAVQRAVRSALSDLDTDEAELVETVMEEAETTVDPLEAPAA